MNFNLDSLIDVHEVALIKDKVAGSKFSMLFLVNI
jgi:hypothetical protein